MPTAQQIHVDHHGMGNTHPYNLVAPACGSHLTQGTGRVKGVTELALLLLLPCHPTRTPLLQSGTTEWFHMQKQHLKPMVKVSSHLRPSDMIKSPQNV